MPTIVKFRRGTTAQNNSFTGSLGEITVDTQLKTLRVHDSATAGGFEIVNTDQVQVISNKTIGSDLLPSVDSAYDLGSPSAKWKDLYLSGSTIFLGNLKLSDNNGTLSVTDSAGTLQDGNFANLVVDGNLTVNGSTTTINSTTLEVDDKNITVASGAADSATADGAGITVDGANATILYTSSTDTWDLNKPLGTTVNVLSNYSTSDVSEGTNLYYTTARADSDAKNAVSATDAGGDGSFSYDAVTGVFTYTGPSAAEVRAHFSASGDLTYDSATGQFSIDVENIYTKDNFDSDLRLAFATLDVTTTELAEGTNLYYTTARADSDFDVRLATKSTTDLAEGSNLYYTTARADSDAKNAVSAGTGLSYDNSTGVFSVPASGVAAGTYGSASLVPVITVDAQGFIDSVGEVSVAGVSATAFDSATSAYTISTADGGSFETRVFSQELTRASMNAGTGVSYDSSTGVISIPASGVVAGTYGSASLVPVITVDAQGFVDSIGEVSVAGVSATAFDSATGTYTISTADGGSFPTDVFSQQLTRASVSAGTGVSYNSTTGVISTNDNQIVHDNLSGFVSNEHIDHSAVTITAGSGLTGGGDITTSRTINIGEGLGITVGADAISTNDSEIVHDNLSGFVANEHIDHSGVVITAGSGLTGGGDITTSRTLTVGAGTGITVNADDIAVNMAAFTTSDLSEGANLYYTTARADSDAKNAVSATDAGGDGSFTYNSSTGVFTYTGPSAAETRAHFSGGTGVTYNSSTGAISIGQSVATTADATFNTVTTTSGLVVGGNLQVNGTTTTVNTQNLSIADNMFYLNQLESDGSPTIVVDVGWAANVNDDGSYTHVGMFRDATDNTFKVFNEYALEPDSALEIDTGHASFKLAPFAALTLTGKYLGFDSDFGTKSTTNLTEGSNQYFTTARARSSVSATDAGGDGSFSYDSSTGVFTYTGPSATEVRAHLSAGTGISYNSTSGAISTNDGAIVHDNLSGFVANEHIDHSAVTITAGSGLTGGGDITTSRTINIGQGTGITVGADAISTNDGQIVHDNLSGFVANEHIDHSAVSITAGSGLTGGGTIAATRTINVGAGSYIIVNADDVAVDATSANTASKVVARDASGNFSAGTITATLSGTATTATNVTATANDATNETTYITFVDGATGAQGIETDTGLTYNPSSNTLTTGTFSGALSGNATTATALQTARTLGVTLTGDVTGSGTASFDGSGNSTISFATTVAANSVALGTDTTGSYVAQGATSGNGISGSVNTEGGTFTVTSNATNANTGSTIVFRDASGNFSAGTITAALSGNATTATTLQTGRTIALSGDVTATGVTFDGSGNITLSTTIAANSVALGTDTTGNYVAAGATSGNGISGSVSSEGGTFTVTSNATNANTGSTIVFRDASGNFSAGTITAALSGNASTATTLQTARSIALSGDVTGSASFNGSADITITATVADDSHNHIISNVDGLQTALDAKANLSGATFTGDVNAPNFNSTSDESLKENVETIANASDKVAALRGVNFNWKENGNYAMGVIAQEVEAVIPEVVTEREDGIKTVNYQAMVGVLIEAIKDLQQQISDLKK